MCAISWIASRKRLTRKRVNAYENENEDENENENENENGSGCRQYNRSLFVNINEISNSKWKRKQGILGTIRCGRMLLILQHVFTR